ncbi:MAG: pentapeptide repeat-containing protein [Anaerolineae bacterium]|nr:pentapeptide repeat-containing protein [Anaerolineae bacterium]
MFKRLVERVYNIRNRDVGLILVGMAIGATAGSIATALVAGGNLLEWGEGFLQGISTEMLGAFLTFVLIEVLIVTRKEREAEESAAAKEARKAEEKAALHRESLLRALGSTVNTQAIRAAEEMRALGWLLDGSLERATLNGADLQNADLTGAHLVGVQFYKANLRGAHLGRANLSGAHLVGADLRGAVLAYAVLNGTYLQGANLDGIRTLSPGQLNSASRLKGATMPDGTRYDGRFNLPGDLRQALKSKIQVEDPAAMADFYGVPVEDYLAGQHREARRREKSLRRG